MQAIADNYTTIAKYTVLGLRSLCPDEQYKIGDLARNSYDWDAENDCSSDEELDGTSVILLDNSWLEGPEDLIERINDMLPTMKQYYRGKHIVLLGGWRGAHGTDEGEGVIVNAKVLAVLK